MIYHTVPDYDVYSYTLGEFLSLLEDFNLQFTIARTKNRWYELSPSCEPYKHILTYKNRLGITCRFSSFDLIDIDNFIRKNKNKVGPVLLHLSYNMYWVMANMISATNPKLTLDKFEGPTSTLSSNRHISQKLRQEAMVIHRETRVYKINGNDVRPKGAHITLVTVPFVFKKGNSTVDLETQASQFTRLFDPTYLVYTAELLRDDNDNFQAIFRIVLNTRKQINRLKLLTLNKIDSIFISGDIPNTYEYVRDVANMFPKIKECGMPTIVPAHRKNYGSSFYVMKANVYTDNSFSISL